MNMNQENQIPPMTDPRGKHWPQPAGERVLVDDSHALMTKSDFDSLPDYSCTIPTGVYPGKMWRRLNGLFDPLSRPEDLHWCLCWYGMSEDPEQCSVNFRRVLLV